jgi:hypothetical protein
MKPHWKVERALQLADAGLNNCQVARQIGVIGEPSTTGSGRTRLRRPLQSRRRLAHGRGCCARCSDRAPYAPGLTIHAYAYLLGLYLGDGMISAHPRRRISAASVSRPGISLDRRGVRRRDEHRPAGEQSVGLSAQARALEPWQERIVARYPGRLLRGLIHSDGCRLTNTSGIPRRPTGIRATSSPTARARSRGSSATPAIGSTSPGGRTGRGTSPSPGARPLRRWIGTSVGRAEAD